MRADDVRRERRAARRRTLRLVTERRLAREGAAVAGPRSAQASMTSTDRLPTDS